MELTPKDRPSVLRTLLLILLLILSLQPLDASLSDASLRILQNDTSRQTEGQTLGQKAVVSPHLLSTLALRVEIERAKSGLTKSEYRSARSNYRQLIKHIDKLHKYQINPVKQDHRGLIKKAPNEKVKRKIVQSRINNLNKQIRTFHNNIIKTIRRK